MPRKLLRLDLDELYMQGYYHTEFDISGETHGIVIEAKNKKAFLDAFAKQWRENAEELLEDWEDWEDET